MPKAFAAKRIFNGNKWLEGHAIVTDQNMISKIILQSDLDHSIEIMHYDGCIVPGFVDLQIYGSGGQLFSQHLSVGSLETLVEENLKAGTLLCLPTIATNSNEIIRRAIDKVREYMDSGKPGIGGLHLEGPWINPAKKGAHLEEYIKSPAAEEVRELLNYGKGVIKMITVAPEMLEEEPLDILLNSDILISLGHSNATFEEATESFNKGIRTVTHLFNAMSAIHHRDPGIPAAVFNHRSVCASIIPDGIHVDYEIVRLSHAVMSERLFVITDAVTETNEGPYRHRFDGSKYIANGVLSGSALTMKQAINNLVTKAGVPFEEALKMCSLYPARLAGFNDYGLIETGRPAFFVSFPDTV